MATDDRLMMTITAAGLSLQSLRAIYDQPVSLQIDPVLKMAVEKSAAVVVESMRQGKTVYGVNTGFGSLANTRIEQDKLAELQRNLIRSHKAGVGAYLDEAICRLVLGIKIAGLAAGYSGVSWHLIERLLQLFNEGYYPCLHGKGSVGASGDLAPLADLAGVLMGEGDAWHQGKIISAKQVLENLAQTPYILQAKEGLSLINGTQVSTGLTLAALFKAERVFGATLVSGALSVEAIKGSHKPFHPEIQRLRRQKGQQLVGGWYRDLLANSDIHASHQSESTCSRVQDPYCLRCQPVVMGACLDQMQHVAEIVCLEASAVTDNPLVLVETAEIVSGGNFHAEPIAFAADNLALAIAEMASMAERRIALLMDTHFSHLPPFLVSESGLNSGMMIAHVTAAALVSENKSLAHPASVDSIPTSANQEDHVSMAAYAGRRLHDMLENAAYVISIELLSALRGLLFQSPLKTSPVLETIRQKLAALVPINPQDHVLSNEIEILQKAVLQGDVATILLESQETPLFHCFCNASAISASAAAVSTV